MVVCGEPNKPPVLTTSAQKLFGSLALESMHRASSNNVMFILFATLFCCSTVPRDAFISTELKLIQIELHVVVQCEDA